MNFLLFSLSLHENKWNNLKSFQKQNVFCDFNIDYAGFFAVNNYDNYESFSH